MQCRWNGHACPSATPAPAGCVDGRLGTTTREFKLTFQTGDLDIVFDRRIYRSYTPKNKRMRTTAIFSKPVGQLIHSMATEKKPPIMPLKQLRPALAVLCPRDLLTLG